MAHIRFETFRRALAAMRERIPRHARIIDLGCGTGASTELVRRQFPDAVVSGVDISAAEIEIARQRAGAAGLDIDYRVADLFEQDYPTGSIDLFLSVMALHYAGDAARLTDLLRRLARALRESGLLVAQIANPDVSLPYRDYGIEHLPPTSQTEPRAEGTPYSVRLYAQPHRRFEPDWPAPLVEFTNYVQRRSTYERAFDAAGLKVHEQALVIPKQLHAEYPDMDWTELLELPLYTTFVATRA